MITLHHMQYGRSFRVLWLLEEIGLDRIGPLEIVEHRIGTPEMRISSGASTARASMREVASTRSSRRSRCVSPSSRVSARARASAWGSTARVTARA